MNIDKVIINYFKEHGDTLEGLLFTNEKPSEKITKVNIVPSNDSGDMKMIEFYQGEELLTTIEADELKFIYVGTTYIDGDIQFKNRVIFELKGFDVVRLFIDLNFEVVISK